MKSLLLDRGKWDFVLDASGNLAVASDPYAISQNVACAIRTFTNDLWYDQEKGIPYFDKVLGQNAPFEIVREQIKRMALGVEGVVDAKVIITQLSGRLLSGQVQVIDINGQKNNVSF